MSNFRQITFNTMTRNTGSITNPQYFMNDFVIDQLDGFRVNSVSFVNSVPNIDSRNNKLKVFNSSHTSGVTLTQPTGQWTLSNFIPSLQNTLNTGLSVGSFVVGLNTMTNLITVTDTSGSFQFADTPNNIYYELGSPTTSGSYNVSTSSVITKPADLSGLKCLQIASSNLGSGYVKNAGSNINYIFKLPIDNSYNSVINYISPSPVMISSDSTNVNNYNFSLYDERDRILDPTYVVDWSLTVDLQTS